MSIKLTTNVDNYKRAFPNWKFSFPPRIGEKVYIDNALFSVFRNKRLPIYMEVVDVSYYEDSVEVELWFSEISMSIAKGLGINYLTISI